MSGWASEIEKEKSPTISLGTDIEDGQGFELSVLFGEWGANPNRERERRGALAPGRERATSCSSWPRGGRAFGVSYAACSYGA
jgi:hypothetical protein